MFPLPQLVLFPRATVPLHVFELRYRTMVRDSLSRDRVIAIALLKPGYEQDYYGSPEFHDLACLASFEDVNWLPNDRYELTLLGTTRVHIREVVNEFPYRSARVELLPQHPYSEDDPLIQIDKGALLACFERMVQSVRRTEVGEPRPFPSLRSTLSYEQIVNTMAMFCGASCQDRLALLAEDSVLERGRRLRDMLEHGPVRSTGSSSDTPEGDHN